MNLEMVNWAFSATPPDISTLSTDDCAQFAWCLLHQQRRLVDAFQFRHRCASACLESISPSFDSSVQRAQAFVWLGNTKGAAGCLRDADTGELNRRQRAMLGFFTNDISLLRPGVRRETSCANDSFGSLIQGKRVVVVGPSLSLTHIGQFIDEHDCVVRLNYLGTTEEDPKLFGRKTHVSYYSKQSYLANANRIQAMLANRSLSYAVVNQWKPLLNEQLPSDLTHRIRGLNPFLLVFQARLLAIPRCLVDLLYHHPEEIYVAGTDLYSSFPLYRSGYKLYLTDWHELLKSWSIHDLFFNFQFLRMLKASNTQVHGSAHFCNVLQQSTASYAEKLELNVREHCCHDFAER